MAGGCLNLYGVCIQIYAPIRHREGADRREDLGHVLSRLGLVDVLQLDVGVRLCFHVRHGAGEGQGVMRRVELLDG